MIKASIKLRNENIVDIHTTIDIKKDGYVVIHAPEGYTTQGLYLVGQVVDVQEIITSVEESFIQKIDTSYYDQMTAAKLEASKMREVLDKIWSEKTDDQKLEILSQTEPEIIDDPIVETVDEPLVEEELPGETIPVDTVEETVDPVNG